MNEAPMGIVYAEVTVLPRGGTRGIDLRLIVDTGSVLTWLPRPLLRELGSIPTGRRTFRTINAMTPPKEVGEAPIRCLGLSGTVPVVFGDETDASVLGVTALEILGLTVDPNTGRLAREDVSLALASA
jgi:predicted aspartyl protease